MLDYYRNYELNTVVFRHSSIYGIHQFSTYDQGWIGWFCQKALEVKKGTQNEPIVISGNGKQVRDILYVDDVVDLYFRSVKNIDKVKGKYFNIGGGIENSISLLELFEFLENEIGIKINWISLPWRNSDQKVFIAKIDKITETLSWKPKINKEKGIKMMIDWLIKGDY